MRPGARRAARGVTEEAVNTVALGSVRVSPLSSVPHCSSRVTPRHALSFALTSRSSLPFKASTHPSLSVSLFPPSIPSCLLPASVARPIARCYNGAPSLAHPAYCFHKALYAPRLKRPIAAQRSRRRPLLREWRARRVSCPFSLLSSRLFRTPGPRRLLPSSCRHSDCRRMQDGLR